MANCNEIGKRIKEMREARGLTQKDIADKLHVKRETVTQWETGTRDLKTDYTIKLADLFQVSCDEILRGVHSENADIYRETGLSDEEIAVLKNIKSDIFLSESVKTLLTEKNLRLLRLITSYFFYDVTKENYIESEYYSVPLKVKIDRDHSRLAYAGIIEYLSLMKEKTVDSLKQSFIDNAVLEFTIKNADIEACHKFISLCDEGIYPYDLLSEEIASETIDSYSNNNSSHKWEHKLSSLIAKETHEEETIRFILTEVEKRQKEAARGKHQKD